MRDVPCGPSGKFMNERVLRITEYHKIIDMLTARATSEPGRKLCRALLPLDDIDEIERLQTQTADAVAFIFRKGSVNFGSTRDFTDAFRGLAIEASLTPPELLHLASFLENVARVRAYGHNDSNEDENPRDSLYDLFDCLYPIPRLVQDIRRAILSEEEIADDASAELKRIRRQMLLTGEKIHSQLSKMLSGSHAGFLQDSVITMRDDRYCLPIRAEFKSQVPGIVHDQSSSGSTLFIEPAAVVELNNQIRALEIEEKKEIERILAALSAEAGTHLTELKDDAANMTALDFIFARAQLALEMNATRPVMNETRYINLRKARHPLIERKKVVPIDISIGGIDPVLPGTAAGSGGESGAARDGASSGAPVTTTMLVITGPNTGGKTVTLKTVGLLSIMAMAGLHIPAADRSELSVFREVFADIGDEQSIEQNLSTFSAHMTTIVDILRRVDRDCLCLFDELGAGTDPTEGAALAISILNFMHVRGIRTLATTHYSELKVYAMRTPGIINASCEFDVESLMPTYHLLMGVAGKSNAFAISKRLGLPNYIIETAREQIDRDTQNFEDLIAGLEDERRAAEKERSDAEKILRDLEKREKALAERERQMTNRREEILRAANEEARDILAEAKKEADEAISDLLKSGKGYGSADMQAMERTRSALRDKVNSRNSKLKYQPKEDSTGKKLDPSKLMIGDRVKVISMGLTGTVSTLPDRRGKLFVQCGIIRSQVEVTDLALVEEDTAGNVVAGPKKGSAIRRAFSGGAAAPKGGDLDFSRAAGISAELNLLGLTTDDAIMQLDKYLDDARMSHLDTVRIVHGKGTGALRQAVHNYLKRQKWVKSYRSGDFGEGDAGVTIVKL